MRYYLGRNRIANMTVYRTWSIVHELRCLSLLQSPDHTQHARRITHQAPLLLLRLQLLLCSCWCLSYHLGHSNVSADNNSCRHCSIRAWRHYRLMPHQQSYQTLMISPTHQKYSRFQLPASLYGTVTDTCSFQHPQPTHCHSHW